MSVARCSDGTWFTSDVHYCGLFSIYRKQKDWAREMESYAESEEERRKIREEQKITNPDMVLLATADTAENLTSMKRALDQLGFTPMAAPR
jgi:hypothetical protein